MPTTTPDVMMVSDEDNTLAADIGMKIPAQDCILSWDDFKNHVCIIFNSLCNLKMI
jgi:hypothetical protein